MPPPPEKLSRREREIMHHRRALDGELHAAQQCPGCVGDVVRKERRQNAVTEEVEFALTTCTVARCILHQSAMHNDSDERGARRECSGTLKSYGTFLCLSALRRRDFDSAGLIGFQANLC